MNGARAATRSASTERSSFSAATGAARRSKCRTGRRVTPNGRTAGTR
jgi:hypothetical protein